MGTLGNSLQSSLLTEALASGMRWDSFIVPGNNTYPLHTICVSFWGSMPSASSMYEKFVDARIPGYDISIYDYSSVGEVCITIRGSLSELSEIKEYLDVTSCLVRGR